MKKRITLLLVFFVNIIYICYAQTPDSNRKVESFQIAYYTKELALTPDESAKFWPVYNNYKNEIKTARKEKGSDQIALEESILSVRKKYKNDFKNILGSDERVNKMFLTEKTFWETLRKELIQRRLKGEKVPDDDD